MKRKIYYRPIDLKDASYFHVVNYDGVSTYPEKLKRKFYLSRGDPREVTYFRNRYMTYLI